MKTAVTQGRQKASMGPRLISRGNLSARCFRRGPDMAFNGAAADQPRKLLAHAIDTHVYTASMGPRLISRGNKSFTKEKKQENS